MRKKKWTTPILTVLVRGNPEEKVLAGCKVGAAIPNPGGPQARNFQPCTDFSAGCTNCMLYSAS
jgi:hypothetical protein